MLNGDNAPLSEDCDAHEEDNRNHGRRIDGHGFLVLNKAQTVCTFGWMVVIATLF